VGQVEKMGGVGVRLSISKRGIKQGDGGSGFE
jgi:hypothetical protein